MLEVRSLYCIAIFSAGYICLVSADEGRCYASNTLEKAFGQVITTKLEDQTEAIKESLNSGFEEQNQKNDERFQAIQSGPD